MTNLSLPLPGMEARASGDMHEQTFNEHLAEALRVRRKSWRDDQNSVIAERTNVFEDATALRPDILVKPPDIYPVVIEVEWGDPASADAKARLGKWVAGTSFPVRSAIAVGAPPEIRSWSTGRLKQQLSLPNAVELKLIVFSSDIEGTESPEALTDKPIHSWPDSGSISGSVEDLAELCEHSAAPPALVSRVARQVSDRIHSIAEELFSQVGPATAKEIAIGLGQSDMRQGLRMACCIWLTSLRLHDRLCTTSLSLQSKGLKTIAELKSEGIGGVLLLSDLRDEWSKILDVNYGTIFSSARAALHDRIPAETGSRVMMELSKLAERISALRLGDRIDFGGELFPKLLEDREETASHYTLPETAELLSRLSVGRLERGDWSSADDVSGLRIADFACGTGTLLRTAYQHIRRRHEEAGGRLEGIHRSMIESAVTGLDINTLASHMTAAGISMMEIGSEYHSTSIASTAVIGGKTGSLELLEADSVVDVTGQVASTAVAREELPTNIEVPDKSQHLIIQNPPYLRARGDRKMFDVTGISEDERKRSVKRLNSLRNKLRKKDGLKVVGQAGLGCDFSALADLKLASGGVFASVLPLTAAHAESWSGFRERLARDYREITVIAFASHESSMMSADTGMNEMLVIATKGTEEESANTAMFVNLNAAPVSVAEASWFAKLIEVARKTSSSGGTLRGAGMQIGSWTKIKLPATDFPWFPAGMQNHQTARTAGLLMNGRLYSVQLRKRWKIKTGMTTLGEVAGIGPTHDLIGHVRGGDGRGAFTFDEIGRTEVPTYPALWAASSKTQTKILVSPTHDGTPTSEGNEDAEDLLSRMIQQRSDLFISRTLRMTSQALAAARTADDSMGGRAWTALFVNKKAVRDALALWLNSTLGLMMRVCYAQTTQPGRATMQIKSLSGLPVPNLVKRGVAGKRARRVARENFEELSKLRLDPVSYAFEDSNRHQIDEVVLEMLGLGADDEIAQSLAHLRRIWCREPSVHGGSKRIKAALGM